MIKGNCVICKKVTSAKYLSTLKRTCSYSCGRKLGWLSREVKKIKLICKTCKREFCKGIGFIKQHPNTRYCSRKCTAVSDPSKWKLIVCVQCSREFKALKTRIKRKLCSVHCRKVYLSKKPPYKKNGYWYENGYRVLYLKGNKSIKEHIKVMEDMIGRKIGNNEVVHHKNQIKDDNRSENLLLMHRGEHSSYHRKKNKKDGKHLFGGYHGN